MTFSQPLTRSSCLLLRIARTPPRARPFSTTPPTSAAAPNKNRIYTSYVCACPPPKLPRPLNKKQKKSVRHPTDFSNLLLISASTRRPLITLWTASWCPSCKTVAPHISSLISDGAGEATGGVGYAEVEVDAATIGDLPMTYRITSMPTLLAFDRGEAQFETRVTSVEDIKDVGFVKEWIEREAGRGGEGGAGGGKSLLGRWFG